MTGGLELISALYYSLLSAHYCSLITTHSSFYSLLTDYYSLLHSDTSTLDLSLGGLSLGEDLLLSPHQN